LEKLVTKGKKMATKVKKRDLRDRKRVKINRDPERRSKVVGSMRDEQEINHIVSKAIKTGQLPVLMNRKPIEKLPNVDSYQDALNIIANANQEFEKLDPMLRREFGNDPAKLLEALQNPEKNLDLLQKAKVLEPVQEVIDPIVAELKEIQKVIVEAPEKTEEQPPQS
jgi:phage internal scaffolding protein